MSTTRDNLRLFTCLLGAAALHALLLPLSGQLLARNQSPPPDVRIVALRSPEHIATGRTLAVEAVVRNVGGDTAAGPWEDVIALSRDSVFDESDTVLRRRTRQAGLAPASEYRVKVAAEVAPSFDGPYFLLARSAGGAQAATPLWIDGGTARLRITALDAPPVLQAGGYAHATATIRNIGDGYARPRWADRLVLSADDAMDPSDLPLDQRTRSAPLAPGASYTTRFGLEVPRAAEGGMHLIAHTAHDPTRSKPIEIASLGVPDLALVDAEVPEHIIAGQETPVRFRVANHGPIDTDTATWFDRVYLSMDTTLDEEDVEVTNAPNPLPLAPGERYATGPLLITLDRPTQPRAYLLFVADADEVVFEDRFTANNVLAVPFAWRDASASDELTLGRDEPSPPLAMAWISHEAFEALRARQSRVEQPALQDKVDPVAEAPVVPDPAPPAVEAREPAQREAEVVTERPPEDATEPTPVLDAEPTPQVATPAADAQVAAASRGGRPSPRVESRVGEQPMPIDRPDAARPEPSEGTIDQPAGEAPRGRDTPSEGENPDPAPTEETSDTDAPRPAEDPAPTPPTVATRTPREGGQPTSAARSDREAPPVQLTPDVLEVKAGKVITVEGIEIKTAVPNFSPVARQSASPRTPKARVLFDKDGVVLDVTLLRSSGSDNVDGPIISSLYRWKASGEKLKELGRPFVQEFTILLR